MPRLRKGQPVLKFDKRAFGYALKRVRKARKLLLKQVEAQTEINKAVLSRIEHAKRYSPDAIILLSRWANINPTDFVKVNRKETS